MDDASRPASGEAAPLWPEGGLFERLRAACLDDWRSYTRHPFVLALADGTLEEASFRHYLVQDYLFLIHFSRAYALAAYKSDDVEDIRAAGRTVVSLADTEMKLHVRYCAGWGIDEAAIRATPEAAANMAYTRYVLERGMAGDVLDLYVALAPCVVGYAEIAAERMADPATRVEGSRYRDWLENYSGADYQAVARAAAHGLDRHFARRAGEARFPALVETFRNATRLEARFWEMGLTRAG